MALKPFHAVSSFAIGHPGIYVKNPRNGREGYVDAFKRGQVFLMDPKDAAKHRNLVPVDEVVEQATAAPGEKRTVSKSRSKTKGDG